MSTAAPALRENRRGPTFRKIARGLAALLMLAIGVGILTLTMTDDNAANRDFISYWAAGQQLARHGNPYDGPAILRIEKAAGFHDDRPFFMRNAPDALFLAFPLGFVGARAGAVLWSLLIIGCLMASVRLLRSMYGAAAGDLYLAAYLFPPVLACILAGQTGVFVLLGVVLFLRFHRTRPAVAGASLLLLALKPHLLLPFETALLAWSVLERRYRLLACAAAAFLASCVLAFWLDPRAWQQYAWMMRSAQLQDEFIPTLSLVFRLAVYRNASWLQFVPSLVACGWALRYFLERRAGWEWTGQGQLLLLVSIAVAPYAWFTDQSVVLPALMGSLSFADQSGRPLLPLMVLPGIAMLEVFAGVQPNSPLYLWTPLAWLAVYFYSRRLLRSQPVN